MMKVIIESMKLDQRETTEIFPADNPVLTDLTVPGRWVVAGRRQGFHRVMSTPYFTMFALMVVVDGVLA